MRNIIIAFLFVISSAKIAYGDFKDIYESVCNVRIELKDGYTGGTGFTYKEDKDFYYIMTAAHVVEDAVNITLIFYHNGISQPEVSGELHVQDYNKPESVHEGFRVRDAALIKVNKNKLTFSPKIIPLADENYRIKRNDKIVSLGCPNSTWPSAFLGAVDKLIPERFYFWPDIAGGRSGSPVYNEDCSLVIGIAIWHTNSGAVAINHLGISKHNLN
jgi:V8-like Glu-specific endopeptidase